MAPRNELEVLALFVHGATAALHALGLVYNMRRKNWLDAAAHGLGVTYDLAAARAHARALRESSLDARSL